MFSSRHKDRAKAAIVYRKACDGGEMLGCYNLGVSYENGHGVRKDAAKAKQLYGRGCDGGLAEACAYR